MIDDLNWMRNQLAHNLKNQAVIESDVKWLIENYHKQVGTKPDWNKDLPKLLTSCVLLAVWNPGYAKQEEANHDHKVFEDTKAKAEKGDPAAQNSLGVRYANGEGVAKDYAEAVKWWRKAAEQNHATAQFNLGNCYADGQGVAKDEVEAAKWYRNAAEQNWAKGQAALGACYNQGLGVTKDEAEAVKWFLKAAEQGEVGSQFLLGLYYDCKDCPAKDAAAAVMWYRKAAEQGFAAAQFFLALPTLLVEASRRMVLRR